MSVSVIIRTRNVEKHLIRLLRELSHQTRKPSEIIVVNNFSTEEELQQLDEVLFYVREKVFDNQIPINLISISDHEFSHSYSTNLGIDASKYELVCITNGHSLPTSISWLEHGVEHFKNVRVAGVSGYFLSEKDGSSWEKIVYNFLWPIISRIRKGSIQDDYFSTINCIIRKSLWKQYPFDDKLPQILPESKVYGGEDYDWAQEMRSRGHRVIIDQRFNVFHSHGYTLPEIIVTNIKWYKIRKRIKSFQRPRKSTHAIKG